MTIAANPVNAWDRLLLKKRESTFNTRRAPSSTSDFASWAYEAITVDLGPPEVGAVHPKKDRGAGRSMQTAFVEGRVEPIPFSIETSVKSRTDVDLTPQEDDFYAAAGLVYTGNSGVSVVYSLSTTPIETANVFCSLQLTRFLGSGLAAYEAEQLNGCVVRKLIWEGGDKELTLKVEGVGCAKSTQGALNSITLGNGSGTTLTHSAEESYRLDAGYYLCESEIILISARSSVGIGSTSSTIARGALSSTGAGHTSQPLNPYVPSPTYTGSPIPETTCTVTFGGVTTRAMSWSVDFTTGADLLPGESGSKYRQGLKFTRYDVGVKMKLVLSMAQVSLLGKATSRATAGALALTIVQGGTTGGIYTFSIPLCEVEAFKVGDTVNDVAIVDVSLRVRDGGSNTAMTITLT